METLYTVYLKFKESDIPNAIYCIPDLKSPCIPYTQKPWPTLLSVDYQERSWAGPMVCCPYPRKLESLTICKWNLIQRQHFPLSYLKTLSVGVTVINLNPWSPAWKSDAQPTEPLILGHPFIILFTEIFDHSGWDLSDFTMADGRRF